MASINKEFTGTENELKEAAHILIKLNEALTDYDRTLNLPERLKVKRWKKRSDEWIERNIKTTEV